MWLVKPSRIPLYHRVKIHLKQSLTTPIHRSNSILDLEFDSVSSPFEEVNLRCQIALPPSYFGKEKFGFEELLNESLLKHDPKLGGVLLSYKDCAIEDGQVSYEQSEVVYKVRCRMLVFNARRGMRLKGEINQVTAGHISVLVSGTFQASISKEHIHPLYQFDRAQGKWQSKQKGKRALSTGSKLQFWVKEVHDSGGPWFIEGSLHAIQEEDMAHPPMSPTVLKAAVKKIKLVNEVSLTKEDVSSSEEEEKKKKKKKKKKKTKKVKKAKKAKSAKKEKK